VAHAKTSDRTPRLVKKLRVRFGHPNPRDPAVWGALLVLLIVLLWPFPLLMVAPTRELSGAERLRAANDVRVAVIQMIGVLGLFLGGYVALRRAWAADRNVAVEQEALITERFTRAIGQLGSDKLAVRIGAIFALERIARDSERDAWPILQVLAAYVRERAPWRGGDVGTPNAVGVFGPRRPPTDIQAVLSVIGRRHFDWKAGYGVDSTRKNYSTPSAIDLSHTDLRGANLSGSDLSWAILVGANLEGAILAGTDLSWACLIGARLDRANLTGASLDRACLSHPEEWEAGINVSSEMDLHLLAAHLESIAFDPDAIPVSLAGVNLAGAGLWSAGLRGVDLSRALNLTQGQIDAAEADHSTRLPPGLVVKQVAPTFASANPAPSSLPPGPASDSQETPGT
jgi:hypothetical protein